MKTRFVVLMARAAEIARLEGTGTQRERFLDSYGKENAGEEIFRLPYAAANHVGLLANQALQAEGETKESGTEEAVPPLKTPAVERKEVSVPSPEKKLPSKSKPKKLSEAQKHYRVVHSILQEIGALTPSGRGVKQDQLTLYESTKALDARGIALPKTRTEWCDPEDPKT